MQTSARLFSCIAGLNSMLNEARMTHIVNIVLFLFISVVYGGQGIRNPSFAPGGALIFSSKSSKRKPFGHLRPKLRPRAGCRSIDQGFDHPPGGLRAAFPCGPCKSAPLEALKVERQGLKFKKRLPTQLAARGAVKIGCILGHAIVLVSTGGLPTDAPHGGDSSSQATSPARSRSPLCG